MKKVAIGGGQGFWGDSPDAAIHMIRNADIQYMGCDYLAELTLSIMAKQQLKDPTKGFAPDFTTRILKEAGKEAWDKHIRICTNAGGMNINGCVDGIRQWAEGNSMSGYKIGYVTGDNIKDKIPQLLKDGWTFPNFDYDGNFNDILDKIYNCNVYIGHEGIEGCLAEGADVVITGRAADSALFLAPLKYEFGWAADDWDNLARGIMAGHLLECGGQGAGGNYMYDWRNVPRMDELGFPIAELTDDTFEITKAPDCGGIICEQSCKEQFLYEVHDPANYLTPDVNVDISHATITQVGDNRVRIGGVKGKPRPDTLKLCVGYHKGWKTVSMLSFAWPDEAWKTYALEHGVSRSVISYLDIRPEDFYKVETTVDGLTVVTPRAWEDLSEILQYHEELGLAVSEELTTQYLQNKQVARDFAIYYELYQKYRQAYNIDAILQGVWDEDVLTQARSAKMDERMSLVSLLLEAVFLQMERCTLRHDALCLIVAALKAQRGTLDVPGDALTALAGLEDNWRAEANKAPSARQKVYLDLLSLTAQWHGELSGSTPFSALKACYQRSVADLQAEVAETQKKLGNLLRFLQEAFGKGTELSMAVNDLTVAPVATAFLGQFLSTDYFAASRDLLLHRQSEQLLHQIDLTGLV